MATIIFCTDVENLNWQNEADCGFVIKNDGVDIWLINIPDQLKNKDSYINLLSNDEKGRVAKYLNKYDRERYAISQGMLRILLGKYLSQLPNELQFARDAKNKPFVKHRPEIHFNISHSADIVLIGIAGSPIGVDVEKTDSDFYFKNVIADQFSPVEQAYVNSSHPPYRTFYKLWTRKEAILKGMGLGVVFDINATPALDGEHAIINDVTNTMVNRWMVNSFGIGSNYVASIACKPGSLSFWRI